MTIEDDYAFTFKVDWWIVDDNCFELPALEIAENETETIEWIYSFPIAFCYYLFRGMGC